MTPEILTKQRYVLVRFQYLQDEIAARVGAVTHWHCWSLLLLYFVVDWGGRDATDPFLPADLRKR
jgi:hypothetical protein